MHHAFQAPEIRTEALQLFQQLVKHPTRHQVGAVIKKYTRNTGGASSDDHLVLGDVAARIGHQFAGYLSCHARNAEFSQKLPSFPVFSREELDCLRWGQRFLEKIVDLCINSLPRHIQRSVNPYSNVKADTSCEVNLGSFPPGDILAASFLGHPAIAILSNSPKFGPDIVHIIDNLKKARMQSEDLRLPGVRECIEVAKNPKRKLRSAEHYAAAAFCLFDSLENLMNILFASFRHDEIPLIDEDSVIELRPKPYGSFEKSSLRSQGFVPGLLNGDPFAVRVPHIGWEEPELGVIYSLNTNWESGRGFRITYEFQRLDHLLSSFSGLLQ